MRPSDPAESTLLQRHWLAVLVVTIGIVIGQSVLYGPCLTGNKVFLPLDILAQPGVFIPRTPENAQITPLDPFLVDLVYIKEPERRFMVSEFQQGRFPLWNPDRYAGAPCFMPKLSPLTAIELASDSPVTVAWRELMTAILAGAGMFCFCRFTVGCSAWPSVIAGWVYPLSGFFMLWQGYELKCTVAWLPWLLIAVEKTACGRGNWSPLALALLTYCVATTGQVDVAGQVLLVSGLFSLWCLWGEFRGRSQAAWKPVVSLAAGWLMGLLLASPHLLPAIEYTQTGNRTTSRSVGAEERPPGGILALPLIAFPDYYGRPAKGNALTSPYKPGNQMESAGGAYAGVMAMLFAAPLAFFNRERRSFKVFLVLLGLFGVGWWLNNIIVVALLRMPGLNMMSHNRLVFVTSFAFVTLAALGLDSVLSNGFRLRKWRFWFVGLLAVLAGWFLYRSFVMPPAVRQIEQTVAIGDYNRWAQTGAEVAQIKRSYASYFRICAAICLLAAACWCLPGRKLLCPSRIVALTVALWLAELLWSAHGRRPQCEPSLYYPKIPALEEITRAVPGRVVGNECLPANLASMPGLRDIRGCDGVDPKSLVEILMPTAQRRSSIMEYGYTQFLIPEMRFSPHGQVRLHPVLDMLNVRYVIGRGQPMTNAQPLFESFDYYVLENTNALPRAFIPASVELVPEKDRRLDLMRSWDFEPRKTAYVETPMTLPQQCRGEVETMEDSPTRVRLNAKLETAGLVVLADLWDRGWHATLNGAPTEILRVNHAVRGVLAPPGEAVIEFVYAPAGFKWGLRLAGAALVIMAAWGTILCVRQRKLTRSLTT